MLNDVQVTHLNRIVQSLQLCDLNGVLRILTEGRPELSTTPHGEEEDISGDVVLARHLDLGYADPQVHAVLAHVRSGTQEERRCSQNITGSAVKIVR